MLLSSICDVMNEAYKRNWITTRDGNISIRDKNLFYITPSGVIKHMITPDSILVGKIDDNNVIEVLGKPSGEFEMHGLLQTVSVPESTQTVIHFHPTYTIAAMHRGFDLQKLAAEFPEVSRYTKVGPTVPTLPAVSRDLAIATYQSMVKDSSLAFDIVGQKNHGICAIGKTPWEAFEHVERLEHICKIVLASGVNP